MGQAAVGATSIPPGDLSNAGDGSYFIDRIPERRDRAAEPSAFFTIVAPGTFAALGLDRALVAALFGFGGIAAGAVEIAKILFFIFVVLFVISLIAGLVRREKCVRISCSTCIASKSPTATIAIRSGLYQSR